MRFNQSASDSNMSNPLSIGVIFVLWAVIFSLDIWFAQASNMTDISFMFWVYMVESHLIAFMIYHILSKGFPVLAGILLTLSIMCAVFVGVYYGEVVTLRHLRNTVEAYDGLILAVTRTREIQWMILGAIVSATLVSSLWVYHARRVRVVYFEWANNHRILFVGLALMLSFGSLIGVAAALALIVILVNHYLHTHKGKKMFSATQRVVVVFASMALFHAMPTYTQAITASAFRVPLLPISYVYPFFGTINIDRPRPEAIGFTPVAQSHPHNIMLVQAESLSVFKTKTFGGTGKASMPFLESSLASGTAYYYENVSAAGPFTSIVVLETLGLEFLNLEERFDAPSLFSFAKTAGYQTAWISGTNLSWNSMDSRVGRDMVDMFYDLRSTNPNGAALEAIPDYYVARDKMGVVIDTLEAKDDPWMLHFKMVGCHIPYYLPKESLVYEDDYDNSILATDMALQEMVAKAPEDTWVFFYSDNGMDHGATRESLTVPLVVFPPKASRDRIAHLEKSNPYSVMDVAYTVLELLGYPGVDSHGLAQSLLEPSAPERTRYYFSDQSGTYRTFAWHTSKIDELNIPHE